MTESVSIVHSHGPSVLRLTAAALLALVPIAAQRLYQPVNEVWTLTTFGCGCPPILVGETAHFNANHFNAILFGCLFVALAGTTFFLVRTIPPTPRWLVRCMRPGMLMLIAAVSFYSWAQSCWM